MAYFQHRPENEENYTRRFQPVRDRAPAPEEEEEYDDQLYDDGFDELEDEYDEEQEPEEEYEISEEERRLQERQHYRMIAGFWDFGAVFVGVLVILALVAFLISMLRFVTSDFTQNFSLFQTRF